MNQIPNIEEKPKTGYIPVTLDYAPEENGKEFDEWCEKYGFTPLESGRRAWCGSISTYFRDALGVAQNPSGDIFLFDKSDLEPYHQQLQKATIQAFEEGKNYYNTYGGGVVKDDHQLQKAREEEKEVIKSIIRVARDSAKVDRIASQRLRDLNHSELDHLPDRPLNNERD